jgi:carboxylesterase type B
LNVPVLVFLHGGGFAGGSQSIQIAGREIYDPTSLVRASLALHQPLIVVTANYRVGPLGFLASAELVADHEAAAPNTPAGNHGLHDQRRALEWCRRFIAGFGGDPQNVTIHGSSAGAVSAHYHCAFPARPSGVPASSGELEAPSPLFRRAILSSGTFLGNGPGPLAHCQKTFDAYVQGASRISTASGAQALPRDPVALRSCPGRNPTSWREQPSTRYGAQ